MKPDFKFGKQLRFAKSNHQIPLEHKIDVTLGQGSSPKFWGFPVMFLQRLKLA